MRSRSQHLSPLRITVAGLTAALVAAAVPALASPGGASFAGVAAATPRVAGAAAPNALTPELVEVAVVQGSQPLENPVAPIAFYGYGDDGPMVPAAGDVQTADHEVEATKTEPDKTTYLVLPDATGPDPAYDYGRRFLFQGHEGAVRDELGQRHGALTRVNLDTDPAHRVTLMATTDVDGNPLPAFDGSTWDPFARRLLLTAELGSAGGVWQATAAYPSEVEDVSGALGRGGYEGIQTDADGRVWIVEDVGGPKGSVSTHARQPNSFVYRFVPTRRGDLTQGRLEALQVLSQAEPGQPIRFHAGQADADILSQDVADLHTYGKVFTARWVTIHDTTADGDAPFDANALAKAAGATPFKRPENGQFRPGSHFGDFLFDETGDTNVLSEAGRAYGGFGGVFELRRESRHPDAWTLRLVYLGDAEHTGFDNVAFWSDREVVFVEDGGDGLHEQRDAYDSAYLLDLDVDYGAPGAPAPVRLLALGRDPSATLDASLSGEPGFQNDGDNEITGIHVSNGDPGPDGLLGAARPQLFHAGWRVFYTQQHGDNTTYEILPRKAGQPGRGQDR